jgi:microcystin-dependent protein
VGQPFVGEIRMFAGNFPPLGWEFCDGQLLPISENETLFQLLGTTYGGDGESTFGLPNLQSRVPIHQGSNAGRTFVLGEAAGVESVTLSQNQMPQHNHPFRVADTIANEISPANNMPGRSGTAKLYINGESPDTTMKADMLSPTGGSQPHENLQPYLVLSFIISLFGIYPQQS